MKLRIGDTVSFLNEVGQGTITRFKDKDTVFVEMKDGFEIPYLIKKLVPIHTELILNPEVENLDLVVESVLEPRVELLLSFIYNPSVLDTNITSYLFFNISISVFNSLIASINTAVILLYDTDSTCPSELLCTISGKILFISSAITPISFS